MVPTIPADGATQERLRTRLTDLDAALVELRPIVADADRRITDQQREVDRLARVDGRPVHTFGPKLKSVTIARGNEPPWVYDGGGLPAEAERAQQVVVALEAEAGPARAALAEVERERAEVLAEIEQHEAAVRSAEDDRAQADAEREARVRLLGSRPDWIDRAAAVLARLRQRGARA